MDQQHNEGVTGDVAKVGDAVGQLAARSDQVVQDKIEQAKPCSRSLQKSTSAVMDKAADLTQEASSAAAQAVDAVQAAARDVASQTSRAAATVYQQGARARESISRLAAEETLLVAAAIGYGIAYPIHRA